MSNRIVTLHTCITPALDDGAELHCTCQARISRKQAEALILAGIGTYRIFLNSNGKQVTDRHTLLACGKAPRIPQAETIGPRHIERAYVEGSRYHRQRIEEFRGTPFGGAHDI